MPFYATSQFFVIFSARSLRLYQIPGLKSVTHKATRKQVVFEKMILDDLEIKHF